MKGIQDQYAQQGHQLSSYQQVYNQKSTAYGMPSSQFRASQNYVIKQQPLAYEQLVNTNSLSSLRESLSRLSHSSQESVRSSPRGSVTGYSLDLANVRAEPQAPTSHKSPIAKPESPIYENLNVLESQLRNMSVRNETASIPPPPPYPGVQKMVNEYVNSADVRLRQVPEIPENYLLQSSGNVSLNDITHKHCSSLQSPKL